MPHHLVAADRRGPRNDSVALSMSSPPEWVRFVTEVRGEISHLIPSTQEKHKNTTIVLIRQFRCRPSQPVVGWPLKNKD